MTPGAWVGVGFAVYTVGVVVAMYLAGRRGDDQNTAWLDSMMWPAWVPIWVLTMVYRAGERSATRRKSGD